MNNSAIPIQTLKLRKTQNELLDDIFEIIIIRVLRRIINTYIRHKWGHIPKIGLFGPYGDEGEKILYSIAQEVSKRGYLTIMGRGFYLPENPDVLYELTELFPSLLNTFLESPKAMYYLYRHILPSIIDKAIDNLYPIRTNAYELEGCFQYGKPVIGFIINEEVKPRPNDCELLIQNVSQNGIGKECTAIDDSQCRIHSQQNTMNCSFYNLINIPLVQKIWFLTIEEWRLIALNNLQKIDEYLDTFL